MNSNDLSIIQTITAVVGTILALWALFSQRRETKRAAELSALTGLAQVIEQRIAQDEATIKGLQASNSQWNYLANRVNNELKPLLEKIHNALLTAFDKYGTEVDIKEIEKALERRSKYQKEQKTA